MRELMAVAIGGSIGASLRWLLVSWVTKVFPGNFPLGTFIVNVTGSFFLGFLAIYFFERIQVSSELRLALMVGLLGSFTTFSTFALDAIRLIEKANYSFFILYIGGQLILSLSFVCLGMYLANTVK